MNKNSYIKYNDFTFFSIALRNMIIEEMQIYNYIYIHTRKLKIYECKKEMQIMCKFNLKKQ